MKTIHLFRRWFLLSLVVAFVPAAWSATPAMPDERDRQVIEALLLHLVADTNFDVTRLPTQGATIILNVRTPAKTGFLSPSQMRSDVGNHQLPGDAENDLRRRNTPADARPDTYEAVAASFTNFTFAPGIVVADLNEMWKKQPMRIGELVFIEHYPKARGWVELYLPGYSEDGTSAIVRGPCGPWAHAAMLTAVLEKAGDKWTVKWFHVARYA